MGKKRKLTDDEQKQLLLLKSTYQMHTNTREEALLRGKTDSVERIDLIIKDTLAQMSKIDKEFTKKCIEEVAAKSKNKDLMSAITQTDDCGNLFDALSKLDEEEGRIDKEIEASKADTQAFYAQLSDPVDDLYSLADKIDDSFEQKVELASDEVKAEDTIYNNVDPMAQYDLIPLPSKGECYKLKIDKVPVGYLTAADENLITSPNLYESGSISNILLKKKILNKNVDVDSLISGDVDAIMVFLRGTSYGNDFPIVATDPRTGNKIETTVDLSKLHYKPFTLKGDENGNFEYVLPRTKQVVKFKFLTKKEERLLQKLNKKENEGIASFELNDAIDKIKNALQADNTLSDANRNVIIDANTKLQKWADSLNGSAKSSPYTKTVTNTMEMQIVSINGNTDKSFIHQAVMNMPASDSLAFRRYIYDNQPGVDFKVEIQRPESMGGGSFQCFLEWDDYVFWHIS